MIKNKIKKFFEDYRKKVDKEKGKKIDFYQGSFSNQDLLSPSYFNLLNPKYFEIDQKFYSTILIVNYYREQTDLILKNLIDSNLNLNISIFYEKQNPYKIIKDLTYHIGTVAVELKDSNQNRQDIDIAAFTYNDAKYIRKEIQVNGEDFYFLYIYIMTYANEEKELDFLLNRLEGLLESKGLQTRRAYFRQEQGFLANLPLMINPKEVKEVTKRNVLTNGIISTYPFISSSICDEKGIFVGTNLYNNSLIFINKYNAEKYKNANMCIFGTSGAGKSFYTKLLIIRSYLWGIDQYVIDPEREYEKLCQVLEGTLLKIGPSSETYINIFDIRKESIEDSERGYLATKISKLIGFFNLIFGEINEEEKAIIEEKIIQVYQKKGITFEDESLFQEKNDKRTFIEKEKMPILEDFYNLLAQDEKTIKFKIKLIPFVKGSLNFFNHQTNVEMNHKLIVADIYELGEDNLKYGMYLFTDLFWDKIKENRNKKKTIYMDEIWRLIGITSNKEVASFIYRIFKTIRKYGGSGVAITQDIADLFSLENGIYGRSILNNSSIKTFFSLEEENIKMLEKYMTLSEKEKIEIKSLKKGECLMCVGDDHILTKIESSKQERDLIEGRLEEIEEDSNSDWK